MQKNKFMKNQDNCPCGSNQQYDDCCGLFHLGEIAETAEQLMRSRYSAYTLNNESYLLQTWFHETRPSHLNLSNQPPIKWIDLTVLNHTDENDKASVEFIARYKLNGKAEKIHELSEFVKLAGRWFYVSGVQK